MKKQKEPQTFSSPDLYLAAAITLELSRKPDFEVKRGVVFFHFPPSDALYRAVAEYNSGMLVNVLEYSMCLKELKAIMYQKKAEG